MKTRGAIAKTLTIGGLSTSWLIACGEPSPGPAGEGEPQGTGSTAATGVSSNQGSGSAVGVGGTSESGGSGGSDGGGGQTTPQVGDIDAKGWKLVWSDEFPGEGVDAAKWEHEINCDGGGNNELQCYVDDTKNSFVSDGALHIVVLKDNTTGGKEYSSARLRTRGRADYKYGRFEARIKLPFGQGLWPAFWMLPTDNVYGTWAKSGELDILEAVNTSSDNNLVYGTLHYGDVWPGNVHTGASYNPLTYVADTFHVYAVEWEEGEVRWFVDDVHYETQNDWYSTGSAFPAPFDQKFHMLLNVAVGGNWPGNPSETTTFPQEMIVEYVRVFQCSKNTESGVGCGSSDPDVQPL